MNKRRTRTGGWIVAASVVLATMLGVLLWSVRDGRTASWALAGLPGSQERIASFPEIVKLSQNQLRPIGDLGAPPFTLADGDFPAITPTVEKQSLLGADALAPRPPQRIVNDLSGRNAWTAVEAAALVGAYLDLGNVEQAVAVRRAMVDAAPDDDETRRVLLDLLSEQNLVGEWLAALDEYMDVIFAEGPSLTDKKARVKMIQRAEGLLEQRRSMTRRALLPETDNEAFRVKLIDAFPKSEMLILSWSRELKDAGRCDDVVALVEPRLARYGPSVGLWEMIAGCYENRGRLDEVTTKLEQDLDPAEDLRFSLYAELLRKTKRLDARLEQVRGALADNPTVSDLYVLVNLVEHKEAKAVYDRYAPQIAARAQVEELLALAKVAGRVGGSVESAGLYLDAAVLGGEENPKLWLQAAQWINDQGAVAWPLAASPATALRPNYTDTGPGVVGGLLSLGTNRMNAPEGMRDLPKVGARFVASARATQLARRAWLKTQDPQTGFAAASFIISMLSCTKQPDRMDQWAAQTFDRFGPDQLDATEVLVWHADAARLRKDVEGEIAALQRAVEHGRKLEQHEAADAAQERLENRLVAEKRYAAVVALKWDRVERFPDDENAMRDLLSFAERYKMFEDVERAYRLGIKRFDQRTWSDKFARWLLRRHRQADFETLVDEMARAMGEGDLGRFLNDHVQYRSKRDAQDWFFEKIYLIAVERFPANISLNKRLLDFYDYKGWSHRNPRQEFQVKFLDLALRIAALDDTVPPRLLARLGQHDMLRGAIAKMEQQSQLQPVEVYLWTRAQQHLARPEAARQGYDMLARHWPRHPAVTQALATVSRSLGNSYYVRDAQLYQAAAEHYGALAARRPLNTELPTLQGEAWVEAGRPREAATVWESIIAMAPGEESRWLEVATLYWDYYLAEQAKHTLQNARTRLSEPDLYAKEMAYLLEDEGRVDDAVAELVKVMLGVDRWMPAYAEVQRRLDYVVRKKKTTAAKVEAAFWRRLRREGRRDSEGLQYVNYLRRRGEIAKAKRAAYNLLPLYEKTVFAEGAYKFFAQYGDHRGGETCLRRLLKISERDPGMLRRAAGYYEGRGHLAKADKIVNELLSRAETPSEKTGKQRFAAEYFWRTKRQDRALEFYRRIAERDDGSHTAAWITYAARAREHGQADRALAALLKLHEKEPLDDSINEAIAAAYAARQDREGLVAFYEDILQTLQRSNWSRRNRQNRETAMRTQLIAALTEMGRRREAIEHHIKIVNLKSPDTEVVESAIAYAQRYDQVAPLLAYYERESKRAHRDFRWQYVTAQIYEAEGRYADAAMLLGKAVINEPQRIDLLERRALVLIKAGNFDGAVEVYKTLDGRRLTGDDYQMRIAEVLYVAKRPAEAEAWLDEVLGAEDIDHMRQVKAAFLADRFGRAVAARRYAGEAMAAILDQPEKRSTGTDFYELWLRSEMQTTGVQRALQALEQTRGHFEAASAVAHPIGRKRIRQTLNQLHGLTRAFLATWLGEYATAAERDAAGASFDRLVRAEIEDANERRRDRAYGRAITAATTAGLPDLASRLRGERLPEMDERATSRSNSVMALLPKRMATEPFDELLAEIDGLPKFNRYGHRNVAQLKANMARALGFREIERTALRQMMAFDRENDCLRNPQGYEARYFSLLSPAELDELCAKPYKHSGPLLTWLARQHETARAVQVIDARYKNNDSLWKLAVKTLLYQHDEKFVAETRAGYQEMLGLPLAIGRWADEEEGQHWAGRLWTHYAHRYGAWLALQDDEQALDMLYARPERWPITQKAYLDVVRALDEAGQHKDAAEFLDRAGQFGRTETLILARADHFKAQGKKRDAAREYDKLLEGRITLHRVTEYAKLMAEIGYAKEGMKRWSDELADRLPRLGAYDRRGAVIALSRFVTEHFGAKRATDEVTGLLATPHFDTQDLRALAEGKKLPDNLTLWLWAVSVERIADDPRATTYAKTSLARAALVHGLGAEQEPLCAGALALLKKIAPEEYEDQSIRLQRLRYLLLAEGVNAAGKTARAWAGKTGDYRFAGRMAKIFADAGQRDTADRVWIAYYDHDSEDVRRDIDWYIQTREDRRRENMTALLIMEALLRQDREADAMQLATALENNAGEDAILLSYLARAMADNAATDAAKRLANKAVDLAPRSVETNREVAVVFVILGREKRAAQVLSDAWQQRVFGQKELGKLLSDMVAAVPRGRGGDWQAAAEMLPAPLRELTLAYWFVHEENAEEARAALTNLGPPLRYPRLVWSLRAAAERLAANTKAERIAWGRTLHLNPDDSRAARRLAWLQLADEPFGGLLRLHRQGMPINPAGYADGLAGNPFESRRFTQWLKKVPEQEREALALSIAEAASRIGLLGVATLVAETARDLRGDKASRSLRRRAEKLRDEWNEQLAARPTVFVPSLEKAQ
ncbi:MAG: hypothetical protein P9L99_21465 [Candidatus Lernaella stagnicola]|nr:hypothetical protein [Candidatus Lernaella stagnicola]